jgi:hypothetical protein
MNEEQMSLEEINDFFRRKGSKVTSSYSEQARQWEYRVSYPKLDDTINVPDTVKHGDTEEEAARKAYRDAPRDVLRELSLM